MRRSSAHSQCLWSRWRRGGRRRTTLARRLLKPSLWNRAWAGAGMSAMPKELSATGARCWRGNRRIASHSRGMWGRGTISRTGSAIPTSTRPARWRFASPPRARIRRWSNLHTASLNVMAKAPNNCALSLTGRVRGAEFSSAMQRRSNKNKHHNATIQHMSEAAARTCCLAMAQQEGRDYEAHIVLAECVRADADSLDPAHDRRRVWQTRARRRLYGGGDNAGESVPGAWSGAKLR